MGTRLRPLATLRRRHAQRGDARAHGRIGESGEERLHGLPFAAAVATGAAAGQQAALAQGGNLSAATATEYATIGANTLRAGGNVNLQAQNLATNEYSATQGLFASYPQNIKMLGLSFNTQIQKTGTALQGEVAYRHDVPLQLDDVELIYASLTPFETGIAKLLGEPTTGPGHCVPASATPITGCNQLGLYGLGQTVQGYELKDTWHFDFTATQVFANVLKASQAVLVVEAGADYVNLPNKLSGGPEGFGLRFDGPGTNLSDFSRNSRCDVAVQRQIRTRPHGIRRDQGTERSSLNELVKKLKPKCNRLKGLPCGTITRVE